MFDVLLFKSASETPNNMKFYRMFFGDVKGVNHNTMFSYFIQNSVTHPNDKDDQSLLRKQRLDAAICKINNRNKNNEALGTHTKIDLPEDEKRDQPYLIEDSQNCIVRHAVICKAWYRADFPKECFLDSKDRQEENTKLMPLTII